MYYYFSLIQEHAQIETWILINKVTQYKLFLIEHLVYLAHEVFLVLGQNCQ